VGIVAAVCVLLSAPVWLTVTISAVVSIALVVSWFFEKPREGGAEAEAQG
jgi:hypothetical protein